MAPHPSKPAARRSRVHPRIIGHAVGKLCGWEGKLGVVIECFQQGSRESEQRTDVRALDHDEVGLGRPLVCVRCRHLITTTAARIEVAGSHRHVRTNPHGIEFAFACFAVAPGCQSVTPPSSEFSWFAGYTWEIGCCERCREHLGWRFAAADQVFFGLIVDRLVEEEPPPKA